MKKISIALVFVGLFFGKISNSSARAAVVSYESLVFNAQRLSKEALMSYENPADYDLDKNVEEWRLGINSAQPVDVNTQPPSRTDTFTDQERDIDVWGYDSFVVKAVEPADTADQPAGKIIDQLLLGEMQKNNPDANVVKGCLEQNANPNLKDTNNISLLNLAVKLQRLDLIQILLSYCARPIGLQSNGRLISQGDIDKCFYQAAYHGDSNLLSRSCAAGADLNGVINNNATALFVAARNGYLRVTKAIVVAGADLHTAVIDGSTPLFVASQNGHRLIVQYLIGAGADVNTGTNNGSTALIAAAQNGHVAVVQDLFDAGADVNTKMNDETTALYLAVQNGHENIVQFLLEKGANFTQSVLNIAAKRGNPNIIKVLLAKGGRDDSSGKAVIIATERNNFDAANLILAQYPENPGLSKFDRQRQEDIARKAIVENMLPIVRNLKEMCLLDVREIKTDDGILFVDLAQNKEESLRTAVDRYLLNLPETQPALSIDSTTSGCAKKC